MRKEKGTKNCMKKKNHLINNYLPPHFAHLEMLFLFKAQQYDRENAQRYQDKAVLGT